MLQRKSNLLSCLKDVTFLSNSDAHSQDPRSLGREINKFEIDNPSFEEIVQAITRKNSRKITLNIGLHPKLGKYYKMFCNKCRRRILFKKTKKAGFSIFSQYSKTENFVIYYTNTPDDASKQYIDQVAKNKMVCSACKEEKNKNFKVKLGVSERIDVISQYDEPQHPNHRPEYVNAIPLVDIIRSVKGIKSSTSKTVTNAYKNIIESLGIEFEILLDKPIAEIRKIDEKIAEIIKALRENKIEYTPGGGGTYGQLKFDI
jgi:PHP family Zn ribbon phosphoesterase